jgi:acyl dehydratase
MGERIIQETPSGTREPVVLRGLEGLEERAGQEIGTSSWRSVEQDGIDTFAKLTGDEQWIHTDPERARNRPFGATVQRGFLTLGMATGLLWLRYYA